MRCAETSLRSGSAPLSPPPPPAAATAVAALRHPVAVTCAAPVVDVSDTVDAVQSISRAFAVLRLLATGPQRVTDVAEDLGLPKSTVVRLLTALESVGAVSQRDIGGEYCIGQGLIDLGWYVGRG